MNVLCAVGFVVAEAVVAAAAATVVARVGEALNVSVEVHPAGLGVVVGAHGGSEPHVVQLLSLDAVVAGN